MNGAGPRPHITVVGLGPAGASYLSNVVVDLMAAAERVLVRTLRHPAAAGLVGVESLDHHYDEAETFEEVYQAMVEDLVTVARHHAPVPIVYAVPGSPLIAERTVELLRADSRVEVSIVPGLSFLDLAWERLGLDPLSEGVRLVDAERFAVQTDGRAGPCLVAQCWSRSLLSEIKLSAGEHEDRVPPEVVLLHHLGLDDEQIVPVELVGHGPHHRPRPPHLALHSPPRECTGDGRDGPARRAGAHPAGPVPVGPGANAFDPEAALARGVLRSPRCPG